METKEMQGILQELQEARLLLVEVSNQVAEAELALDILKATYTSQGLEGKNAEERNSRLLLLTQDEMLALLALKAKERAARTAVENASSALSVARISVDAGIFARAKTIVEARAM